MNLLSLPMIGLVAAGYLVYRFALPARFRPAFLILGCAVTVLTQSAPAFPIKLLFVAVTLAVLLIGHRAGRLLAGREPGETRGVLRRNVVAVLAPLVVFKLIDAVIPDALLRLAAAAAPEIDLSALAPLGISYLTFRVLAYMIEIRAGRLAPARFRDYFLYVTFWPTILSGPIERPRPFLDQLRNNPAPTREDLAVGLTRVATGAFKALVLGDLCGRFAAPLMDVASVQGLTNFLKITTGGMWVALIAYYFHLYWNFGGYSDIAIGLARIFGYRIMENFRWPIFAPNIAQFWRRWHISLTSFVTDYVYIPMGGNRLGGRKAAVNTFAAMILVGLWHGFAAHFIWWGAYHALLLTLYRKWRTDWSRNSRLATLPVWPVASRAFTFLAVALGWVLFVQPVGPALHIFVKLFGLAYTGFSPALFLEGAGTP